MVSCSNCGLDNNDTFAYCVRCGSNLEKVKPKPVVAPVPKVKECPQCGSAVPAMFRFCGTCGHPFSTETRIPPVAEQELDKPVEISPAPAQPVVAPPIPPVPKKTPKVAKLIVINKDGSEGDIIPISGSSMTLGRDSFFSTLSEDPCLSPKHIIFSETPNGFEISDANSLNGIFIGVTSQPIELQPGDQLRFGRQLVEFRLVPNLDIKSSQDGTQLLGSENPNYWGLLSVISHPDIECQVFPIANDSCIVGREKGDIVLPNDFYVSGSHLEIRRNGDQYTVRDLNSSNGTFIRIKKPTKVNSEDKIMMGQQLFLLRFQ